MLLHRMNATAGSGLGSFRLIERGEEKCEESHVITEGKPAGLTVTALQRVADAAVNGAVTLLLLIRED